MYKELTSQATAAMGQLLQQAKLQPGDVVVLGCSTSEVMGEKIGTAASPEVAAALLEGFLPPLRGAGLQLAVQCCEHLNRALVVEKEVLEQHRLTRVSALPQPKAGGSAATAAWGLFKNPVLAENIQAAAGLDVGLTLIGMHLRPVAIPVRLQTGYIGQAEVVAARTRPKFIGGARAVYQPELL